MAKVLRRVIWLHLRMTDADMLQEFGGAGNLSSRRARSYGSEGGGSDAAVMSIKYTQHQHATPVEQKQVAMQQPPQEAGREGTRRYLDCPWSSHHSRLLLDMSHATYLSGCDMLPSSSSADRQHQARRRCHPGQAREVCRPAAVLEWYAVRVALNDVQQTELMPGFE